MKFLYGINREENLTAVRKRIEALHYEEPLRQIFIIVPEGENYSIENAFLQTDEEAMLFNCEVCTLNHFAHDLINSFGDFPWRIRRRGSFDVLSTSIILERIISRGFQTQPTRWQLSYREFLGSSDLIQEVFSFRRICLNRGLDLRELEKFASTQAHTAQGRRLEKKLSFIADVSSQYESYLRSRKSIDSDQILPAATQLIETRRDELSYVKDAIFFFIGFAEAEAVSEPVIDLIASIGKINPDLYFTLLASKRVETHQEIFFQAADLVSESLQRRGLAVSWEALEPSLSSDFSKLSAAIFLPEYREGKYLQNPILQLSEETKQSLREKIAWRPFRNSDEEFGSIAQELLKLEAAGVAASDIAIVSTDWSSGSVARLERELEALGISYRIDYSTFKFRSPIAEHVCMIFELYDIYRRRNHLISFFALMNCLRSLPHVNWIYAQIDGFENSFAELQGSEGYFLEKSSYANSASEKSGRPLNLDWFPKFYNRFIASILELFESLDKLGQPISKLKASQDASIVSDLDLLDLSQLDLEARNLDSSESELSERPTLYAHLKLLFDYLEAIDIETILCESRSEWIEERNMRYARHLGVSWRRFLDMVDRLIDDLGEVEIRIDEIKRLFTYLVELDFSQELMDSSTGVICISPSTARIESRPYVFFLSNLGQQIETVKSTGFINLADLESLLKDSGYGSFIQSRELELRKRDVELYQSLAFSKSKLYLMENQAEDRSNFHDFILSAVGLADEEVAMKRPDSSDQQPISRSSYERAYRLALKYFGLEASRYEELFENDEIDPSYAWMDYFYPPASSTHDGLWQGAVPVGSDSSALPYFSATQLDYFAASPYDYFKKYVLRLRERRSSIQQRSSLGILVHYFFQLYYNQLFKELCESKILDESGRLLKPVAWFRSFIFEEYKDHVKEDFSGFYRYAEANAPDEIRSSFRRFNYSMSRVYALRLFRFGLALNHWELLTNNDAIFFPIAHETRLDEGYMSVDYHPDYDQLKKRYQRADLILPFKFTAFIDRIDVDLLKPEKREYRLIDYKTVSSSRSRLGNQLIIYQHLASPYLATINQRIASRETFNNTPIVALFYFLVNKAMGDLDKLLVNTASWSEISRVFESMIKSAYLDAIDRKPRAETVVNNLIRQIEFIYSGGFSVLSEAEELSDAVDPPYGTYYESNWTTIGSRSLSELGMKLLIRRFKDELHLSDE
ncbi:MAG: PD-(D/E)XK nuclease family protein [Eubacteriales bacterium]|nr:PD-(D/E)XK nuclease family protein [Eubacteriales bacterium]